MRLFNNIGPLVRVDIGPDKFYGQIKDNFLYMQIGCIHIPYDALITPMEVLPVQVDFKLETKGAKTPFEKWQLEKYGDFVPEDEQAESYDDIKQYHYLDHNERI